MDPSFKSSTEVIDPSSVSTYSDDEISGNFLVDSSSSDAGNLHSPPSDTPAKTAAPSNELKAAFVKTVESLKVPSLAKKEKLELLNKLVEFSSVIIDIKDAIPISNFIQGIRLFVVHQNKTIRTASLRVLRYYMRTDEFITELISQKLHFFISRSLDREKQNEAERMQALKLVRKIMEVNCSLLPRCIVHSLVSIAENAEDNFSRVAIETICEITIRNPRLSAHCNGIKLLILSILDPNLQGLQESLLLALIYLLNNADTRKYIRPSLDIALLLGPLTDNFYPKDRTPEKESKWAVSIKALVSMLKTWTGLIVLASHPLGLKSLVNALRLPFTELHDRILDAIFDIFKLTVAKESNPFQFKSQSRSVDESATPDVGMDIGQELPSRTRGERHNLLNNYLSALLISFMDCGLLETLVELGSKPKDNNEERNNIAIKSTLLLGELLYLTNTLLPPSQCAKVQTLPKLVEYAASFELDSRLRSRAASMVSNLHQYHHLKHASSFYDFHLALIVTGANKWKRLKGRDRRLDRMDEVKLKIDFAMDADQFKNKIQDTQVLTTKDAQRWKWDIISDLLEGPLNNPNLVTYALLKTKFVKRILSFLRPQAKVFAKMAWSLKNLKYVRMACQLLEVLVSSDAGKDYLCNSKLIPEIAEQLDLEVLISNQKEDPKKENRLLKAEGVLKTMSREYFTMLGTLSSSPRGLEILNKFNIFKYLLDLTEIQGRVDLSHLIMTSLDYNMASGQARTILGKALNSASKVVRYLATRHMGILLRAGVQDFSEWGIDYLVKQLSDPDSKVTRSALSILDEACDEVENMDSLISKRPTVLLKLNQAGKDLWLRFLSRSSGFKFLVENEFVQREMKIWKDKLNKEYVNNVERALAESFSPAIYKHRESDHGGDGVYLSPHFYGELTKTKEGAEVLENSKHFLEFVATIKNKNNADTLEVKAALWAIGNIGASKTGFVFLENEKAVQMIVQLADECPSLSVRGTCFYVLGMLSRTEQAREILDSLGWESPANLNSCISVPKNIKSSTFFKLSEEKYEGSLATSDTIEYYNPKDVNEIQMEIITAVGHLSNSISAESASRTLKRLRALHPEYFASPALLYQVFKLLGTYKFRLPVRRFIYDIFDGVTMEENQWDSFTE